METLILLAVAFIAGVAYEKGALGKVFAWVKSWAEKQG